MPFAFTTQDIIYAAVLALFFTWLIKSLSRIFKVVITRATVFDYQPEDLERVLQKCYALFPTEIIRFNGAEFQRGMKVRVITNQHKTIEGQFIGINRENMACFVTPHNIVAQELDKIDEIYLVEG